MHDLVPIEDPRTLDDALAVPPEERGFGWYLTVMDFSYKMMGSEVDEARSGGEQLFAQFADPTINTLRGIGQFTVWEEIKIWHHAKKHGIPEKQGYESVVEWVQGRGDVGWWYDGPTPDLNPQTIRAYLRVYEFWCLEWGIETIEMGGFPFGKLRDCLSFARTLKEEDRAEFMDILLHYPRDEIVARYQLSKAPPPPPAPEEASPTIEPCDLLSKETALGPDPPEWLQISSPSQARRYYLDWKSGRLWAAQPGSESLMIGVIGQFNRRFLSEAHLLVSWLRDEGAEAEVMDGDQIEDALLEFCRKAGIHHD
jgi:hypothetical protein